MLFFSYLLIEKKIHKRLMNAKIVQLQKELSFLKKRKQGFSMTDEAIVKYLPEDDRTNIETTGKRHLRLEAHKLKLTFLYSP